MLKTKLNLSYKNVAIVTHRSLMPCIPGEDLKQYLLTKNPNKIMYITHPLLLLNESYQLSSKYEYLKKNKLLRSSSAYHFYLPEPLAYIKDFICTIYWIYKTGDIYDLYFGINNMNALSGLLLKKIGRVKKVVYYTIDLYPQRFESKLINWIYHRLDNFCVVHCDETWNVSPYLLEYRLKKGVKEDCSSRQFTVPIGIWFSKMTRVSEQKVNKNKIAYVGHLKNFYGVDLVIRALPLIKKSVPNIYFDIVGGGEQMDDLKQLANKLKVSSMIKFHGWKEKKVAEKIISDAAIGLAPFDTKVDEKIKNADPAKIKDYLALGLPVITTAAPRNATEIEKAGCALVIDYTPLALTNAVVKLLTQNTLRKEYRRNALKYVKQFDWNNLFDKNIFRLL